MTDVAQKYDVAIVGAGPVCSIPAADEDVDAYLTAWDALLARLAA